MVITPWTREKLWTGLTDSNNTWKHTLSQDSRMFKLQPSMVFCYSVGPTLGSILNTEEPQSLLFNTVTHCITEWSQQFDQNTIDRFKKMLFYSTEMPSVMQLLTLPLPFTILNMKSSSIYKQSRLTTIQFSQFLGHWRSEITHEENENKHVWERLMDHLKGWCGW
jgi:hypothetical protein